MDKLEEYVDAYDEKDAEDILKIYDNLPKEDYKAYDPTPNPFVINECAKHIEGFASKEALDAFKKNMDMMEEPLQNFTDMINALKDAESRIRELSLEEIDKVERSEAYQIIMKRAELFLTRMDQYLQQELARYQANVELMFNDINRIRQEITNSGAPATHAQQVTINKADTAVQYIHELYKQSHKERHKTFYSKIRGSSDTFARAVKSIKRKRQREQKAGKAKEKRAGKKRSS